MTDSDMFSDTGTVGHHHKHEDDEIDVTPMIDMTFLLLAFFMVTSSMDAGSTLQLPAAEYGKSLGAENATIISIYFTEGQSEIYLADGRKENGPVSMSEVAPYVRQGIASRKSAVLIKADRETPSGFVEEVARAANQAEGVTAFYVGIRDYTM